MAAGTETNWRAHLLCNTLAVVEAGGVAAACQLERKRSAISRPACCRSGHCLPRQCRQGFAMAMSLIVNETIRNPDVLFAAGIDGDPMARGLYWRLAPTYDLPHGGAGYPPVPVPHADGTVLSAISCARQVRGFTPRCSPGGANREWGVSAPCPLSRSDGIRLSLRVSVARGSIRHLGSVEAAISFRSVREAMMRNDPERDYALVLFRWQCG